MTNRIPFFGEGVDHIFTKEYNADEDPGVRVIAHYGGDQTLDVTTDSAIVVVPGNEEQDLVLNVGNPVTTARLLLSVFQSMRSAYGTEAVAAMMTYILESLVQSEERDRQQGGFDA